jgi:hypothetical protein
MYEVSVYSILFIFREMWLMEDMQTQPVTIIHFTKPSEKFTEYFLTYNAKSEFIILYNYKHVQNSWLLFVSDASDFE